VAFWVRLCERFAVVDFLPGFAAARLGPVAALDDTGAGMGVGFGCCVLPLLVSKS
jgi:hypothetical protein